MAFSSASSLYDLIIRQLIFWEENEVFLYSLVFVLSINVANIVINYTFQIKTVPRWFWQILTADLLEPAVDRIGPGYPDNNLESFMHVQKKQRLDVQMILQTNDSAKLSAFTGSSEPSFFHRTPACGRAARVSFTARWRQSLLFNSAFHYHLEQSQAQF